MYKFLEKKTNITLDDLIANANVEQLKQYQEYLIHFRNVKGKDSNSSEVVVDMPMKKNKRLKLELKPNKNSNVTID